MKRLIDDAPLELVPLRLLALSVEPFQPNPFSKRLVYSRIQRELAGGRRGLPLRPALFGAGALLIAASATAAAGFGLLPRPEPKPHAVQVIAASRPAPIAAPTPVSPEPARSAEKVELLPEKPGAKRPVQLRSGEDPTQVTEAVRALRKQGDPARAQALLDRYLSENPRGALSEDALALAIEAAASRKDPRAQDYARRYLSRYPNGRFRAVAERALGR